MEHPVEYVVSHRDLLRSPRGLFCHGNEQPPPYTTDQMISKGITAIEVTGIFTTALLKWNGIDPVDQDWANITYRPDR